MEKEIYFVYDGWNIIEEITRVGGSDTSRYFVWGLDISQSLQGAGSIGGLIASVDASTPAMYYYQYDANGNVGQVVNASDGSTAAAYDYDPFGNIIHSTGILAYANPFRFSTKYFDRETGLYYYGYRYYSVRIGRWLTKDPLEEQGGLNLYAFCLNNPINFFDALGLIWVTIDHDYHGTHNLLTFLFNRIVSIIGKGDEPSIAGSDPKELERTRRDVIQEWQHDPENPCRDSEHTIGARRKITQTFKQKPPRQREELWDKNTTH